MLNVTPSLDSILQTAIQHHLAGRLPQAEALYRQILQQNPGHAEALHMLGCLANQVNRYDLAIDLIRQALALSPSLPDAHNNLGTALQARGDLHEAAAALRQAVALDPNSAVACYNLANVLREQRQLEEAIAAYRQAIALDPAIVRAHFNLGNALRDQGQLDDALAAYRQAMTLDPHYSDPHATLAYTLLFHPGCDARAIAEEHRRWNQQHAAPLRGWGAGVGPFPNDKNPDRPLRIGYVSPDFRDHVIGFNLLPLLRHHRKDQFAVYCYSGVARPDGMTNRFRALADVWCPTAGVADEQLARQIRADRIDILVDLSLHLHGNRLLVFARKPAPVQVTFAGYPGSTGLQTIDYRLSDPFLDPPGMFDAFYSEKTVRLPHSFWCYIPLSGEPPVNDLPAAAQKAITFGCLNNFCKVNETTLRLWAKIMRLTPGSRLILLSPHGAHRQHAAAILAQEGIAGNRLEFVSHMSRDAYLHQYHRIDIGLDTLPYNGHTTSLDALWMGVPVVTLVGQTVVGRAGYSQLMNLGLPELIAHTPAQFIEIVTSLAQDLPRVAELRRTLRNRLEKSPLADAVGFARDIEAAYRQMWQAWCAT